MRNDEEEEEKKAGHWPTVQVDAAAVSDEIGCCALKYFSMSRDYLRLPLGSRSTRKRDRHTQFMNEWLSITVYFQMRFSFDIISLFLFRPFCFHQKLPTWKSILIMLWQQTCTTTYIITVKSNGERMSWILRLKRGPSDTESNVSVGLGPLRIELID